MKHWKHLPDINPNIFALFSSMHHQSPIPIYIKPSVESASIGIAAITYAKIYATIDRWSNADIDKILSIGRNLHKISMQIIKNKNEPLKPRQVATHFYLDLNDVTTLVGALNISDNFHMPKVEKMGSHLENILKGNDGCLLHCNGTYYAIWPDTSTESFYLFYPCEHTEHDESGQKVKETCCIKIAKKSSLVKSLIKILNPNNSTYELDSVKIMQINEVYRYPDECPESEVGKHNRSETSLSDNSIKTEWSINDVDALLPESFDLKPYLVDFNQAFTRIDTSREILRGKTYVEMVNIQNLINF